MFKSPIRHCNLCFKNIQFYEFKKRCIIYSCTGAYYRQTCECHHRCNCQAGVHLLFSATCYCSGCPIIFGNMSGDTQTDSPRGGIRGANVQGMAIFRGMDTFVQQYFLVIIFRKLCDIFWPMISRNFCRRPGTQYMSGSQMVYGYTLGLCSYN